MTVRFDPAGRAISGWLALALLLLVSGAAHTLALWLRPGGESSQTLLGNTLNLIPLLLAALTIYLAALGHRGLARVAWYCIAAGLLLWAIGDGVWGYIELVLARNPFPSLADAFYVGYLLLITAGLILMPRAPLRRAEGWKLGLDVLIVVGAAAAFCWQAFLVDTVQTYRDDPGALALALLYPVADLALLSLLLLTPLRQGAVYSHQIVLVLAVSAVVAADIWYNVASASGRYVTGTPMDSLWSWGAVFFGLAAVASLYPFDRRLLAVGERFVARLSVFGSVVPYAAILVTFYLAVAHHHDDPLSVAGVHIGVAVVTLLVVVRQMLAFAENRRLTQELQHLNQQLERRVAERTRELDENRERLLASEKLAALGRLTAGIAHEVNTPLAGAMNHLLHARELSEEYRRSVGHPQVSTDDHREIAAELLGALEETDASLRRIGEFVRNMRSQSRNLGNETAQFDPHEAAREALALLEPQARAAGVALELQAVPLPHIYGDALRFGQVLSNLAQNAIHACEERRDPRGSRVVVSLAATPRGLLVQVHDNGSGIAPEVLPKIFEPLFTTKPIGKGTGLGLPIIRDIVKGYFGGEIGLETQPGRGTTFFVNLPLQGLQQHQT